MCDVQVLYEESFDHSTESWSIKWKVININLVLGILCFFASWSEGLLDYVRFFLIKYLALFQGQLSRPVWSVSYAFVCVCELPALGFLILPFIREPFASLTLSVYHRGTKVLEPPLAFLQFLPHFIPSISRLLLPYTVLTTWGTP